MRRFEPLAAGQSEEEASRRASAAVAALGADIPTAAPAPEPPRFYPIPPSSPSPSPSRRDDSGRKGDAIEKLSEYVQKHTEELHSRLEAAGVNPGLLDTDKEDDA